MHTTYDGMGIKISKKITYININRYYSNFGSVRAANFICDMYMTANTEFSDRYRKKFSEN